MNRNDFALVGCGGCGNSVVDSILNVDPRFFGFFINTSSTDIQSLDNYDVIDKNYLCISLQNGMGRDRTLGKKVAGKNGWSILEKLKQFDQDIIYLVTSFSGGSGSSITSVILSAIKRLKETNEFNKTVNLIAVLPKINSSDDLLKNALDTWNEIMSYDVVNNMIFIDNNNLIDGHHLDEKEINQRFAEIFDSIFEIPVANGKNFDNGNLGKVLNSKGCLYIYDLPKNCSSMDEALKIADSNSIFAKMYTKDLVLDDDKYKLPCSYVGTSFNSENYLHDDVLDLYKWTDGDFHGYNTLNNIVLISGCLPPLNSLQLIKKDLDDRLLTNLNIVQTDYSNFMIKTNNVRPGDREPNGNKPTENSFAPNGQADGNSLKKSITKNKKNLFNMY